MAIFADGPLRIRYDDRGEGLPVLLLAPGGMRSEAERWSMMPWDPREVLVDDFRVIAMDQRNAGGSVAPVTADDGWASYAADQLALLDHLGVERCVVMGCCIGGSFGMGLMAAAPERVVVAVLLQPIGVGEGNRGLFYDLFDSWADEVRVAQPEVPAAAWSAFRERMYGGDFLFNMGRDQAARVTQPVLILRGDDPYHPAAISEELAGLLPRGELIERWKGAASAPAALARIRAFLATCAAA